MIAVALVGRRLRRPQRLRHDAEHRAAVEPRRSRRRARSARGRRACSADDGARRAARLIGAAGCFSSTSTPCALDGWMNATSAPSAPGRGCSSISRTPRALSCASAARDVVDAQRDVVQPGPALLDVLRDRRIGRRRLEQLERRLADRDEMRAHALRRDLLGRLDLEAERVAIERERRGEVAARRCRRDRERLSCDASSAFGCTMCRVRKARADEFGRPRCTDRPRAPRCDRRSPRARPASSTSRSRCSMKRCDDELAQAVLAARCRRRGRSRAASACARNALDRLHQFGDAGAGRRHGLHDRRPPLVRADRCAAPGSPRPPTPAGRRPRDPPCSRRRCRRSP